MRLAPVRPFRTWEEADGSVLEFRQGAPWIWIPRERQTCWLETRKVHLSSNFFSRARGFELWALRSWPSPVLTLNPDGPAGGIFASQRGDEISFGELRGGVWTYLAVRGGFIAPKWFGSASVNPRAGLGDALRSGAQLFRGEAQRSGEISSRFVPELVRQRYDQTPVLRVWRGPEWNGFASDDAGLFLRQTWIVSPQSDRAGYRLEGAVLESRLRMPSAPVAVGTDPGACPTAFLLFCFGMDQPSVAIHVWQSLIRLRYPGSRNALPAPESASSLPSDGYQLRSWRGRASGEDTPDLALGHVCEHRLRRPRR